jgi:hypothetical protein
MKTVPLYGPKAAGRVALVDDEDYELVMQYHWNVRETARVRRADGPYATARFMRKGKVTYLLMHKLITEWPGTDHIDHDGLNNQRSNLRPATRSQNGANRRPVLGHSSQYKGVRWYPPRSNWCARIRCQGKLYHLGYFADEADAARAYDTAAREMFGEYASPNFPSV